MTKTKAYHKNLPKYNHFQNMTNTISPAQRHENYTTFTVSYPKMQVPFDIFRRRLPKLEKNITTNSNWTKNNKTQNKTKFIEAFSLYSWEINLSLQQKLRHAFQDCKACLSVNTDILYSHSSFPTENRELVKLCNNVTSTF